ncbi:MAG: PTS sugar transporter subunit IIA [Deltaproteobacteria bacterium]|nr:PTS sugar transporter subunit IIA [Deltaproteobacteria bacterium]
MKIIDILAPAAILPAMKATTKRDALQELASLLASLHPEIDGARLLQVLLDREALGSTAIGEGIAIPHGKMPGVSNVVAAFGRSAEGLPFDSLDGNPTRLFFLLIAPEDSAGVHLKALARVSRLLKDKSFRDRLATGGSQEQLFAIIKEEDEKY